MEYLKPSLDRLGTVNAIVLGIVDDGTPDSVAGDNPPTRFKPDDIPAGLDD